MRFESHLSPRDPVPDNIGYIGNNKPLIRELMGHGKFEGRMPSLRILVYQAVIEGRLPSVAAGPGNGERR